MARTGRRWRPVTAPVDRGGVVQRGEFGEALSSICLVRCRQTLHALANPINHQPSVYGRYRRYEILLGVWLRRWCGVE
jgi:hypothetical protein